MVDMIPFVVHPVGHLEDDVVVIACPFYVKPTYDFVDGKSKVTGSSITIVGEHEESGSFGSSQRNLRAVKINVREMPDEIANLVEARRVHRE